MSDGLRVGDDGDGLANDGDESATPRRTSSVVFARGAAASDEGLAEAALAEAERRDTEGLADAASLSHRRRGTLVVPDEAFLPGAGVHRDMIGRSVKSYYFRTICAVCDERSETWWLLGMVVGFCFLLTIQFISLFSVFYMQRLYATWGRRGEEDGSHGQKAFPGGLPLPANVNYMLGRNRVFEKVWFYVPTLLFCIISIMSEARGDFDECRASFMMFHAKRLALRGNSGKLPRKTSSRFSRGFRWSRLVLAGVLQCFRLAVLIQFFLSMVLVLGTSDGVFNIVLNSVAITFILHLDNSVDIDLPDHNFFRLATPSQLLRHAERWADARKIFRCFLDVARDRSSKDFLVYRGIVGGFRFIIGFAVFLCALAIQNSVSSRARFVVFRRLVYPDDDVPGATEDYTRRFSQTVWNARLAASRRRHGSKHVASPPRLQTRVI